MNREVMIVAGEASGDLHGSRLVRSLQKLAPELTFCGIGGQELTQVGVTLLYDAAEIAVVGAVEVISQLGSIIKAQHLLRRRLEQQRPVLLILIDFPDFNLLLARKAKKLGIPIFYYISPQVWAWRSGRVKTIAALVDKIGVILPFEESFYASRGVKAHYVGHPLLDTVRASGTRMDFCRTHGIDPESRLVGLLPGSRTKEISRLLPVFLEAASRLRNRAPGKPVFLIAKAPTISISSVAREIGGYQSDLDLRIVSEERYELMAACDLVVAASGTVTLELLLLDTPMIVAYKVSPHTYRLGRMLVKVDYFSLVNLIAGEEVVPELLQQEANPERLETLMYQLLFDEAEISRMKAAFASVRKKLGGPGASERAARLALSLVNP